MTDEIQTEQQEVNKKKMPLWLVITLVVVTLGAVAYFVHDTLRFQSTDDAYVETTTVSVAPKVSGEVVEVLVTDNQYVHEGDVVARIDDIDYKIKLEQITATYEKTLLNQKNAKANYNARQTDIDVAKKDLERYKNLYAKGAVSKQTLDNAQSKYDSAVAGHTSAEQSLFSDKKDRVADADLKAIKAQKDWAEQQLKYTEIVAPQSGFVTRRRSGNPAISFVGEKSSDDFERYRLMGLNSGTDYINGDDFYAVRELSEKVKYNRVYAPGVEVSNDNNEGGLSYEQRLNRVNTALFAFYLASDKLPSFMQMNDLFPLRYDTNTHHLMMTNPSYSADGTALSHWENLFAKDDGRYYNFKAGEIFAHALNL